MGIRLSFALIVVPMALVLCIGRSPLTGRQRGLALALATAAALVVLTPAFIPWIQDSENFVFGNLGFAALYARGCSRAGDNGGSLAFKTMGFGRKFFGDPGNAFLLLLGAYGLAFFFWNRQARQSRFANQLGLLAALMPAVLAGVCCPTPVHQQYYYALLPFLTLAGLYVVALQCAEPAGLRRWRRILIGAALLPCVVGLPRWYWQVVYLPSVGDWTPMHVHATGEWIRRNCPPNARVMTADPLFPLEAGLEAYPEYATGRFTFVVGDMMTDDDCRRRHMSWGAELERVLTARPPDAIFWHMRTKPQPLAEYVLKHGFRKLSYRFNYVNRLADAETFELWVRDADQAPGPALDRPAFSRICGSTEQNIPVVRGIDHVHGSR
jgi:hypothetical protein